jgi:hypothetical protein
MRSCEKSVAEHEQAPMFYGSRRMPYYRAQGLAGGSLCLGLGMTYRRSAAQTDGRRPRKEGHSELSAVCLPRRLCSFADLRPGVRAAGVVIYK